MTKGFSEPIAPATLQAMRALDQQAASIKVQMESIMLGYVDAKGWSKERHRINMNLVNGTISVEVLDSPEPGDDLAEAA